MAFNAFKPQIWSSVLLSALEKSHVFAQPGVVNRDYEGEIQARGDVVRITSVSDPSVGDYVANSTSITYEELTDAQRQARELYRTRASRRPKGQSRSDFTKYDPQTGHRLPGSVTLALRQELVEDMAQLKRGGVIPIEKTIKHLDIPSCGEGNHLFLADDDQPEYEHLGCILCNAPEKKIVPSL